MQLGFKKTSKPNGFLKNGGLGFRQIPPARGRAATRAWAGRALPGPRRDRAAASQVVPRGVGGTGRTMSGPWEDVRRVRLRASLDWTRAAGQTCPVQSGHVRRGAEEKIRVSGGFDPRISGEGLVL